MTGSYFLNRPAIGKCCVLSMVKFYKLFKDQPYYQHLARWGRWLTGKSNTRMSFLTWSWED